MFEVITDNLGILTDNPYVFAAALLIFFLILVKFILYIIKKFLKKIVKKTETEIDDLIVERTEKPLFWTLIVIGVKASIAPIELSAETAKLVHNFLDSLLIIFVAYSVHVITTVILEHYVRRINRRTASSFHSELVPFTNNFSKIIYTAVALVFILRVWDVNVVPLLAGLGIAGLTIGLSLQNTLSNIIGGISLLLDRNFNIGDEIKLDNETEGFVLDVGLRSTKIRTKNNELVIVPNSVIANSKIFNYAKPTTHLRITIEFSVKSGENIEKLQKLIVSKTRHLDFIEKNTVPELAVSSMDTNIKLKAYFWINLQNTNRNSAKEKLSLILYDILKK